MKCLVTGGAGFIGSHLVKALVDRGDEVTVLDDFSVGRMEHIQNINNINIIKGNVCDLDLVKKHVSECDIVYHLAVKCLVNCNEKPVIAHEVNVGGTFNICLASYEAHARVVYVSSSEVYGTCQSSTSMTENHPTQPQSIYGLSKLMGEEYVQHFYKYYGVPSVIIRPFNAYGPNHRCDQYAAVITSFIRRLENGQYPIIEWTGEQSRDFTYVTDTADGIMLLSEKLTNCEIVNLGSGKATSINYLASTLEKIYGMDDKLIYSNRRLNDVFKLEADTTLAQTYGYKPKVSLEEGLKKYITWYKNNVR